MEEAAPPAPAPAMPAASAQPAESAAEPEPEAEEPAGPSGLTRTSVVISGVPGFSRALALQRSIGQLPGVTEAKAIGYERGVLGLEVQHDLSLDLVARATSLPGIRLTVTESSPGQLHLSAE